VSKQVPTYDICGVQVSPVTISQINHEIIEQAKGTGIPPLVIFKPYVEFLARAAKDEKTKEILNQAAYNIADATSIQWAGAYLYGRPQIHANLFSTFWSLAVRLQSSGWRNQIFPQKMGGVDMTLPLLQASEKATLKIGVLGGPRDTAATKQALKSRFPGLGSVTVWNGFYAANKQDSVVSEIAKQKLDILFVAMGFPKQEKFIIANRDKLGAKVLIGEGGSFDYDQLGGHIRRAPKWVRKIGFEWFWRLLRQPSRLKRQLAIPQFIFAVRKQKKQPH
jgi:N-acetylglucosaminyldiphosphoundecaprenol N-acetyl-beta-D-mannosaminyltransferase